MKKKLKKSIIGEIGERLVVAELLRNNLGDLCLPVDKTQKGWDIVIITKKNEVIKIQVKTTIFNDNASTNNSFNVDGKYDFLVIVAIDDKEKINFLLLPQNKVEEVKEENIKLAVTRKIDGKPNIRECFSPYKITKKADWKKIIRNNTDAVR